MATGKATRPTPDPGPFRALVDRFDPDVLHLGGGRARRVRLAVRGREDQDRDAVLDGSGARLALPSGRAEAELTADLATWRRIADDLRAGMLAFRRGKLRVRHDLHLGVGFLAATSGSQEPERLQARLVKTPLGRRISLFEAGPLDGAPVVCLHGLGATKASFLSTLSAMADPGAPAGGFRVRAIDLPGFGDSDKPVGPRARYDARFFAREVVALLDALEVDRAHLVGNSMGGRAALEVGLTFPDRVRRLGLLAPSMAWRRRRPWAPLLRLVRPELGFVQPAPRAVVERIVARVVPESGDGFVEAGVDEFLRAYLTRGGRAAFYTAARAIYLEEPYGEDGFWPRLKDLQPPSLFVWGTQDTLVPIGFARHVTEALPVAEHLELDCGHVPQMERPDQTHRALAKFFRADA